MDGVHPTHNTQLFYGWIRKGVRKEIRSNTGRQRLNISGAVDLIEKKLHFQQDHMLNTEATIRFLDKIRRLKEEEIAVLKEERPIRILKTMIRDLPPARDFREALRKPGIALIAEVKKSSPSAGIISGELDPVSIALEYESGGASAISVLTESTYFGGDLADLIAVKGAVKIPILRKDFVIDPYQIYEARSAGADAILLIAELLDLNQLTDYLRLAHDLSLSCLVESHSRGELEKAIESGAEIIGLITGI